jgi:hypothetical protein
VNEWLHQEVGVAQPQNMLAKFLYHIQSLVRTSNAILAEKKLNSMLT